MAWKQGLQIRTCTRKDCLRKTSDWYPFSGSQLVKQIRCAACYEAEYRQYLLSDNAHRCREDERAATIGYDSEHKRESVRGSSGTGRAAAAVA